jgi:hypothetical protein
MGSRVGWDIFKNTLKRPLKLHVISGIWPNLFLTATLASWQDPSAVMYLLCVSKEESDSQQSVSRLVEEYHQPSLTYGTEWR